MIIDENRFSKWENLAKEAQEKERLERARLAKLTDNQLIMKSLSFLLFVNQPKLPDGVYPLRMELDERARKENTST